ncbi:hypothetical protein WQ54_21505 [Bacillus sp. SA1-12]|uniref:hypothetical protein n=1 Tax=Bacillus sp. SA1-12 TaxID=1455638 RepID=UPI000627214C|nr:hypothetical protein [Bacillus sp. SA1-12]KKI90522.1 hypothetical protein WQ54_21505 [Bacillus sp. SA1-12]
MKKTALLFIFFIFIFSSSVLALSWAYPFVVWNGKVYEVKQEVIEDSEIGKMIGEVRTTPHEITGNYYGNASNYYPKGTNYYEIKGTSTSSAIAIKNDHKWVKAIYVQKAPFHIMNVLTNTCFISAVIIIALIAIVIFQLKKSKNE